VLVIKEHILPGALIRSWYLTAICSLSDRWKVGVPFRVKFEDFQEQSTVGCKKGMEKWSERTVKMLKLNIEARRGRITVGKSWPSKIWNRFRVPLRSLASEELHQESRRRFRIPYLKKLLQALRAFILRALINFPVQYLHWVSETWEEVMYSKFLKFVLRQLLSALQKSAVTAKQKVGLILGEWMSAPNSVMLVAWHSLCRSPKSTYSRSQSSRFRYTTEDVKKYWVKASIQTFI